MIDVNNNAIGLVPPKHSGGHSVYKGRAPMDRHMCRVLRSKLKTLFSVNKSNWYSTSKVSVMRTSSQTLAFLCTPHPHTSFDVYLQRIPLMSRNSAVNSIFTPFLDVRFCCFCGNLPATQTVFLRFTSAPVPALMFSFALWSAAKLSIPLENKCHVP